MEMQQPKWLLLDGYEDEPAAFGVPPYVGFHIRYIAGVLEEHQIEYEYMTIDQFRLMKAEQINAMFLKLEGAILFAGAIVPGKYLRGTPISLKETNELLRTIPNDVVFLAGGWAVRGWRNSGWMPVRKNLFLAVQDTDATLNHFLINGKWKHQRRDAQQWNKWALRGSNSKAVRCHPDLKGPLTYEVEVYQGCVRFRNGCKFCIEPKKGVPIYREPKDVISEVKLALDQGVKHVRLGGMTDVYTYKAEGVEDEEYPIPSPEPIAKLLHGLREDERLDILHVDNGNPSIIAENIEPAEEITKTLIDTLSDGSILSFGLESVDPEVHTANWLNCDAEQAKVAIRLINKYGRERGERGLPKLLPGLNFIAGLHAEIPERTYQMNLDFLQGLRDEGLWLRRINIRQVEGEGFQQIEQKTFKKFKEQVRELIDAPLLADLFPIGKKLSEIYWESHNQRIRLPSNLEDSHHDVKIHGSAGITFGRQIGAYPILVGVPYQIPLETFSDILVTNHGKRSITGIEVGLDINKVTQKQLEALPGIGEKTAWKLISERAKKIRKNPDDIAFDGVEDAFDLIDTEIPEHATTVFG